MPEDVADEIAAAVRIASRHRLGMLLLLNPSREITGGVLVGACVTSELLVTLAVPDYLNRLHRGAIIIRGDRVSCTAVPLAWAAVVERAAELVADVAIMVDADDGQVLIADRMGRVDVVDADVLADVLRRRSLNVGSR